MPAELTVRLLAQMAIDNDVFEELFVDTAFGERLSSGVWQASEGGGGELLAEIGGRLCYDSFNLPNPTTATNVGYLSNISKQQHWSVMEHANFSFYFAGISRTLTHELVRHNMGFSQLSQRYVDHTKMDYVVPPLYRDDAEALETLDWQWHCSIQAYASLLQKKVDEGVSKKKAAEAARSVLPGMAETKILVTANARDWRFFIERRMSPTADAEIQLATSEVKKALMLAAPNLFQGVHVDSV